MPLRETITEDFVTEGSIDGGQIWGWLESAADSEIAEYNRFSTEKFLKSIYGHIGSAEIQTRTCTRKTIVQITAEVLIKH